jgi:hypothetical protein
MPGHVVLLGDSIFDNAVYVSDGMSVLDHLRRMLPSDWRATLLAVDGATLASIPAQLAKLPSDATHLVLSIGGNDALGCATFILTEPADSYRAVLTGVSTIREEFARGYRDTLDLVRATGLPLAVCTIYDAIPDLTPDLSVGVAVFNDVITRQAFAAGAALIDLRVICDEAADYSEISPIEPSASGGAKIASAIYDLLLRPENCRRVIV